MILLAATGQYKTLLPKGPEDPASVVYTISAIDPPRTDGPYLKIPDGILYQQKAERLFTSERRRQSLGSLVFTTKVASPVKAKNSSRLIACGQVIDFTDEELALAVAFSSDTIIAKHNNDYINIESIGLTEDESDEIAVQARIAQRSVLDSIEELQKELHLLEVDINNIQAKINESTKVLNGLTIIDNISHTMGATILKIQDSINLLNSELTVATSRYSQIPSLIEQKKAELLTLVNLVK